LDLPALLWLKSALVLGAFALFAVWERWRPAEGGPLLVRLGLATRAGLRRVARNLSLFGLNLLLSPLVVLPVTAWAASFEVGLRPAFWSGWHGLALDVLLLDLWIYWWHRLNHEWQPLWRFHQVHHLDETLDTTTAVRFHFGEVLLSALARAGVVVLLDFPLASVVVFEGLVLAASLFHHSDAGLPAGLERALGRVVVTPALHWVHHHALRADTDSNYGTIFAFWDPLFASRSLTRRWRGMPIGVERLRDRPLPRLLLAPFAGRRARANAAAPPARR
jgi:sterol desaturase/sphingolipid hydroxylase (fatty acid hydroxylase superfamily)